MLAVYNLDLARVLAVELSCVFLQICSFEYERGGINVPTEMRGNCGSFVVLETRGSFYLLGNEVSDGGGRKVGVSLLTLVEVQHCLMTYK